MQCGGVTTAAAHFLQISSACEIVVTVTVSMTTEMEEDATTTVEIVTASVGLGNV